MFLWKHVDAGIAFSDYLIVSLKYYHDVISAVNNAYKLLQDEDKVKRVNEILEEARAMVKATVSFSG